MRTILLSICLLWFFIVLFFLNSIGCNYTMRMVDLDKESLYLGKCRFGVFTILEYKEQRHVSSTTGFKLTTLNQLWFVVFDYKKLDSNGDFNINEFKGFKLFNYGYERIDHDTIGIFQSYPLSKSFKMEVNGRFNAYESLYFE